MMGWRRSGWRQERLPQRSIGSWGFDEGPGRYGEGDAIDTVFTFLYTLKAVGVARKSGLNDKH
jgi:hypothetical protein